MISPGPEGPGRDPTWIVTTDSIYVLDVEASRIQRVTGIAPPTPRQGRDGTAQTYAGLWVVDSMGQRQVDRPVPGLELQVQWENTKGTRVSTVVAATDRPAWGRSFWLVDPALTDKRRGFGVIAAGRLALVTPTVEAALVTAALLTVGASDNPSATAIGVGAAAHLDLNAWAAVDGDLDFAEVPQDGWRRPWAVPATSPSWDLRRN